MENILAFLVLIGFFYFGFLAIKSYIARKKYYNELQKFNNNDL